MSKRIALVIFILLTAALIGSFAPQQAEAQRGLSLLCPETALNIPVYQKALVQKVKRMIDKNVFKQVRVRINFRRVGGDSSLRSNSADEVLNGLTLSNSDLTVLATGNLAFNFRCAHTYIARIRVTATEAPSGIRFSSQTDSRITIDSPGEARVAK